MPRPATAYGRFQAPESLGAVLRTHIHAGAELKQVDHEPKCGVLDQQNLLAQGIRVSTFIPGAQDVDALSSCTGNATTVALSNILDPGRWAQEVATSYTDTVTAEKWAIGFYHQCSDQTGDPGQEWPPTDCGSSGPYIVQELQRLGLVKTDRIAHGAQNLVSLLQTDGVLMGSPFLNAWEEPGPDHVVDGDGSISTLERQIQLGVAGGHETYISAVELVAVTATGLVIPEKTVLRVRNSWSRSWGDNGSFYIHLSTLVAIGSHCDFRQLVA